jgi:hypothetical protein
MLALPAPAASAAKATPRLQVTYNGLTVDAASSLPKVFDITGRSYTICYPSGQALPKIFSEGWTIATLITAAGGSPATTDSVTIQRSTTPGDVVTLTPADFDPDYPGGIDFPDGPAFIDLNGVGNQQVYQFFRPQRATTPCDQPGADVNFDDWVQTATNTPLVISIVSGGAHLDVSATANPTKVTAGSSVHLAATVSDPPTGENLTYSWQLTDGTDLTGASVDHTFANAGTYQAVATVVGDRGSAGTAPPLTITVGSAPGKPGGGKTTKGPPTRGGSTGSPTGLGSGAGSVGPNGASGGSGAPVGSSGTASSPGASGTAGTPPARRVVPTSSRASGELIHGELLAGPVTASGLASGAAGAAQLALGPNGTSNGLAGDSGWIGVVAGVTLAAALFLGGAARESKPRRRRRAGNQGMVG